MSTAKSLMALYSPSCWSVTAYCPNCHISATSKHECSKTRLCCYTTCMYRLPHSIALKLRAINSA